MSIWFKRLGLLLAALAIVAAFYWALREQPVLVDTAEIVDASMTVTIDQEGVTRVRDIYVVSSPIQGHLARTTLKVGDNVQANKTVVAAIRPLDPPLIDRRTEAELQAATEAARSAVALAEAEVLRVESSLTLARSELERARKLSASSTISERAFERAAADVAVQDAELHSAQANVRLRQAELASALARQMQPTQIADPDDGQCCVKLLAPVDGTVLEVMAESEQAVSAGAPIAKIGDPADIEIVVDLLSADAVRVQPGQSAAIIDWGGEDELAATVRRIEPAAFKKISALGIEEQRVNVILELDRPVPELGHAFRIYARIAIWQKDRTVQVPIAAIFRAEGSWVAFRLEDHRLQLVRLSLGHMNSEVAEVLDGLAAGDTVVVHPSDVLAGGSLVERRGIQ